MFSRQDPSPATNSGRLALVTGATGAVGPALVWRLHEEGYRVRILTRRPSPSIALPESIQVVVGDITDDQAVRRATADAAVVFHLAAKLHINDPSPSLRAEYERVNVEGTRRLVEAARAAGVCRLVFFSTVCVYGPGQPGHVLDETSPLCPQTLYAQTKRQAEEIVLAARQECTAVPLGVVLRLAAVYGPRIKGNYARLVAALRKGWFIPLGTGDNRRTLVYDQDVATAALLVAEHPQAAGQVYNVTDGAVHTFNDILAAICRALGRRSPRYCLPVAPVRVMAGLLEDSVRLAGRRSPIGRATIDKLLEDVAISGYKIQDLGFCPRFDLVTGWQETVRQMSTLQVRS